MKLASVVVKPSSIHGKVVFAAVNFKAGDIILRRDESRLVTEENPLREGEQEYHCDWLADGRVVYLPEPERYINHSCDPNAYLKEIGDKKYHVAHAETRGDRGVRHGVGPHHYPSRRAAGGDQTTYARSTSGQHPGSDFRRGSWPKDVRSEP